MKELYFVTTNPLKQKIAKKALNNFGIDVKNLSIETPEIQDFSSERIAEYSVRFAYNKIKKPVIKTDVEYCIKSLGGFPGPYAKYINKWLTAGDILKMMEGKKDRSMVINEFITYYDGDVLKTFMKSFPCTLSKEIMDTTKGSIFDQINIREGFTKPQNVLTHEELESYFITQMSLWDEFAEFFLQI